MRVIPQPSHRCFVILILMSSLWCTEAVPLFVTSLASVPLIVFFDVLLDDEGKPKDAHSAANEVCVCVCACLLGRLSIQSYFLIG